MVDRILLGVVIFLFLCAAPAAYGQAVLLTINIDGTEFMTGDTISISGQVGPVVPDERILIQVYGPTGVLTRIEPLASNDGHYAYSYLIDGPLNERSGQYRVMITYLGVTRERTFMFVALDQEWKLFPVDFGGNAYDIRYTISGAEIEDIRADVELATMTISISSYSKGALTAQVPTNLLTNIGYFSDFDPEVFVDTILETVRSSRSGCTTEVTVPFEHGAEEIELIGSWIPGGSFPERDAKSAALSRSFISTTDFEVANEEFHVPIRLDAYDCDFSFHRDEKRLHVNVTGSNGELGYFEITIPHRFLGGNYTVLLEGEPEYDFETKYNQASDGDDSTTIFLFYSPDEVKSIDIIGTTVVPEFGMGLLALLVLSASLMTVTSLRYRTS